MPRTAKATPEPGTNGKPDVGNAPNADGGTANANGSGANGTPDSTRNATGDLGSTIEPTTIRIDTTDGIRLTKAGKIDGRTRAGGARGRIPGGITAAAAQKESAENLAQRFSLEELLISVHAMGAAILSVPEWEINQEEGKKYSDAVKEVLKYSKLSFDPKKVAYVNLAVVAGTIYGTRIVAIAGRRRIERAERNAAKPVAIDSRSTQEPAKQKANGAAAKLPTYPTPSDLFPESAEVRGPIW
jgi:hypothetical protein